MRGRANRADCGTRPPKTTRVMRDSMRYAEGAEGVVSGDAKLVNLACSRFFRSRGMEASGFIPQAHFRKEPTTI